MSPPLCQDRSSGWAAAFVEGNRGTGGFFFIGRSNFRLADLVAGAMAKMMLVRLEKPIWTGMIRMDRMGSLFWLIGRWIDLGSNNFRYRTDDNLRIPSAQVPKRTSADSHTSGVLISDGF